MTEIQILVVKTALKKMMTGGYFDICTIDNILKLSGGIPRESEYQLLRTLHCVYFKEMPAALLAELPKIIQRVIESPSMEFIIDVSSSGEYKSVTFPRA